MSRKSTYAQRAEAILERHFRLSAVAAEHELRPLMLEAFGALLKSGLPVAAVEEAMGITHFTFDGRFKGLTLLDIGHEKVLPEHRITKRQADLLDAFCELATVVGDYRATWCLYDRITKADIK